MFTEDKSMSAFDEGASAGSHSHVIYSYQKPFVENY